MHYIKWIRNTFLVFSLFASFYLVFAQGTTTDSMEEVPEQEMITKYNSQIIVNTDNSIDVTESILYYTPEERHGIYRDIRTTSANGMIMDIKDIEVTDENGTPYMFDDFESGDDIRIKIGDPYKYIQGYMTYVIKYRATRAVSHLEDIDEIYWNVTGNNWNFPIQKTTAVVQLPEGLKATQSACYYGTTGSSERCETGGGDDIYAFKHETILDPGAGMTIAVGFPKGVIPDYSDSEKRATIIEEYLPWFIGALLPIITFILAFAYWYRNGRDPKGRGVIVPQYDVPEHLTPIQVGAIVNEKIKNDYVSAEIIYLATKGYLKIKETEGMLWSKGYELTKLKDGADLTGPQKLLFEGMFEDKETVKLSEMNDNEFYKTVAAAKKLAREQLLSDGYYKSFTKVDGGVKVFLVIFLAMFIGIFTGGFLSNPFPLIAGLILSAIIYSIISYFNPAKTEKGVELYEYLLGLKNYLRIAEKNRIDFHNAPEKKPEVFEKLLPYAMVLGVADIWSKEFEDIYVTPPSWYQGSGANFSMHAFTSSINSFNGSFIASSAPPSSRGGSSGGGSSGGGGGGGGGGSW